MPIVPDDKDWTWVVQRPCPQCGYDPAQVEMPGLPDLLLDNARRWGPVLLRPGAAVRPDDDIWSALEYAAHVRDVHKIMKGRLLLILARDEPVLANWDQDDAAVRDRYQEQDPATVGRQLVEAAQDSADALAAVGRGDWGRRGMRSDGAWFTAASLGRYLGHECVHHLWDVERFAAQLQPNAGGKITATTAAQRANTGR